MAVDSSISKVNDKLGLIDKLLRDYSGLAIAMVAIFLAIFIYGMVTAPNFLTISIIISSALFTMSEIISFCNS